MGLTNLVDKVDKDGRELLAYGTEDFPINVREQLTKVFSSQGDRFRDSCYC